MYSTIKPSGLFYILAFVCLQSCTRYYMPVKANNNTASETITQSITNGKYFILRDSSGSYAMNDVQFDQEKGIISCHLDTLPENHTRYVRNLRRKYSYDDQSVKGVVLNEVHLYTNSPLKRETATTTYITLADIKNIEVIEKDKRRTTRHNLIVGLGITAVAVHVAGIIYMISILSEIGSWY